MMPVSPFCLLKFLKGSTSNFSVPESPGFVSGTFALEVPADIHPNTPINSKRWNPMIMPIDLLVLIMDVL
jgi:hypothetical protein